MRDERGSGSALAVGVLAVMLVLSTAVLALASALSAAGSARAAADLAALAAAQDHLDLASAERACATAAEIAHHNGARVLACSVDAAGVATVRTSVPVSLRLAGTPAAMEGYARAGPG